MNLDQIATKCFILALFIRDDGQRLLLGDGYYDFNQKLQHFQANTIANDVVEIQGDNGQLLAGQVMRSGAQKFEGYIGDATTNRQIIEQKRSDFMAFFRIKHFYKVIYIFPDGTAIQRQRGYLTDAPTIPEIFQKFPEYSVALNFEDANYYEYAEDEHGDEIYAHIAELALAGGATGGLVWDAIGAVTNGITWSGIQTAQGEYIQATNELSLEAPLASVEMLGKAEQDGTPTPTSPQPISVVTGENVVKIEGKNLFDKEMTPVGAWHATKETTQSGLKLTSTASGGVCYVYYEFPFKHSESVDATISFQKTGAGFVNVYFRDKNDNATKSISNQTSTFSLSGIPSTTTKIQIYFYGDTSAIGKVTTYDNIQLELGSTATAYEPYQGQEFEVNLGKNLLPFMSNTGAATRSGVDITVDSSYSEITLNGTCSGNTWVNLAALSGTFLQGIPAAQANAWLPLDSTKTYTLSAKVLAGTSTGSYTINAQVIASDGSGGANVFITPNSGTTSVNISGRNGIYRYWIYMPSGATFTNYKLGLQLEKGSQATSYSEYFTPIELAKIGNYQDRIYKEDSKWYIEKQVGKVELDGSENWGLVSFFYCTSPLQNIAECINPSGGNVMSDYFTWSSGAQNNHTIDIVGAYIIRIRDTDFTDVSALKTWLASNPTTVYYVLATPTTTEITNEALIAQLDALGASSLYLGVNNIGTETLNAMPTLKIEYYTEYTLEGAGYEWEPGGNTAKTIVTVAGVDSAWPIWTIQGGAQNPTLTNITTGQTISWQGFVPEGQTLTINMAEMTADLAGANVFEYITGEWLRLAPGNNTLVYNAGSADKPSTLSWNGVLA